MFTDEFFAVTKKVIDKYPEIYNNLRLYKEHKKLKKLEHKIRINLTIDPGIYFKFRDYCHLNGMKISSKVEQIMKKELNN